MSRRIFLYKILKPIDKGNEIFMYEVSKYKLRELRKIL